MKTHELAKQLNDLAKSLRKLPNINVDQMDLAQQTEPPASQESVAVNIVTLAELSNIKKEQWIDFANTYNIPIQYNQRDSSRNIMGKILVYLSKNKNERSRIAQNIKSPNQEGIGRLNKAFSILLNEDQ